MTENGKTQQAEVHNKVREYWDTYGHTPEIYECFGVTIDHTPRDGHIIKYPYGEDCCKIRRSNGQGSRFEFFPFGKKPKDFVFGYEQLPQKGDLVIITGGEKDVLTLASQGYHAICLNSETASLPDWLVHDLKNRFAKVCLLYDSDPTGVTQSMKLCRKHGLYRIVLPEQLMDHKSPTTGKQCKDVSDLMELAISFDHSDWLKHDTLKICITNAQKMEIENSPVSLLRQIA